MHWKTAVFATLCVALFSLEARCQRIASFFIEPSMGMATVYLRAVEIENSFVSTVIEGEQEDSETDWSNVDPEGVIAPVGRMINYKGSGMELSVTSGLKVSGLKLGLCFSWINAAVFGYSRRYRYIPELLRAGGRVLKDKSDVPLFRLMGSIRYGIPIWKIILNFQTRIGGLFVGKTPLIVGRAVEENEAFSFDAGMDITLRPNKWVSVGVLGYAGAFVFSGTYEGAMGAVIGVNGAVCLYF